MSTADALRERERLRSELERANLAHDEHALIVRHAEDETNVLTARRRELLREQARTGAAAPVDDLDERIRAHAGERERALAAATAASEAATAVTAELEQLHRDRFDEFAEHCETLTGAAMERLAALEPAYREAIEAWRAARAGWNALARDVGLDPVGFPPLPDPADLFSARPPRPPQIRPVGEEDARVAPEHEPGALVTYERADGEIMRVEVGSGLYDALASDPDWREQRLGEATAA